MAVVVQATDREDCFEQDDGWGWYDLDADASEYYPESVGVLYDDTMLARNGMVDDGVANAVHRKHASTIIKDFPVEEEVSVQHNLARSHIQLQASIPAFRVVRGRSKKHAEFLVQLQTGSGRVSEWLRHTDFLHLVNVLKLNWRYYRETFKCWTQIQHDKSWFRRLDDVYLEKKCVQLEKFLRALVFEVDSPHVLQGLLDQVVKR